MPLRHEARYDAPVDAVRAALEQAFDARPGAAEGTIDLALDTTGHGVHTVRVDLTPADGATAAAFEVDAPARVPWFQWFAGPALRHAARRSLRWTADVVAAELAGEPRPDEPRPNRLAPPVPFSPAQTRSVATAAAIALVTGTGASLFSTNIDFIGNSFDASDQALGVAGAVTRVGVVLGLFMTALADRRGRRLLLIASVAGVSASSLVSAVAPDLFTFTAAQTVSRGLFNTAFIVSAIVVVEEAPEGARAYAVAMLALARGAGAAIATLLHPLADLGPDAWRIAFGVHGASILLIPAFARTLPETVRYSTLAARVVPTRLGRTSEVLGPVLRHRFLLIVGLALLTNVFAAPSAQFANRYLESQHGFSATETTIFLAVTGGVPGFVGLVLGGRLAETMGRRRLGAIGLVLGTLATQGFYLAEGAPLWILGTVDLFVAGLVAPALAAFGPELFPTEVRGTANAGFLVAGVIGSAIGLVAVGAISANVLSLGGSIAVMGVASLVVALLVIPRLPEPARHDLDVVSPPLV